MSTPDPGRWDGLKERAAPGGGPAGESGGDDSRTAPEAVNPWSSGWRLARWWAREGKGPSDGWSWPGWSALRERVRTLGLWDGSYDLLIWLALIAVLALYGWYLASPRPTVEVEGGADGTLPGMAAEPLVSHGRPAEPKGSISPQAETLPMAPQRVETPQGPQGAAARSTLSARVLALGGRQTDQGLFMEVPYSELGFPVGRSSLSPGERPVLERITALLLQYPALSLRIAGHTDSSGRAEVNLSLSQERAEAVRDALVRRGVEAGRLQAVGYGESRPIADNATRDGRERNRRIEIYFIEGIE